jgi:hypothetical protein
LSSQTTNFERSLFATVATDFATVVTKFALERTRKGIGQEFREKTHD